MPVRHLKYSDNLVVDDIVAGKSLGNATDLLGAKLRQFFDLEAEVIFAKNGLKSISVSHVYLVKISGQLVATIDGYYGGVLHLLITTSFLNEEDFLLTFHRAIFESLGIYNLAYGDCMSIYNPELGKFETVASKFKQGEIKDE